MSRNVHHARCKSFPAEQTRRLPEIWRLPFYEEKYGDNMPNKPLRPCKHPGCSELTRDASGYCETHRAEARTYERYRGSAASRGYDHEWAAFRIQYLKRHPLCVDSLEEGKIVPATEVHHKKKLRDHPELKYDEDNLMALSHDKHSIRTARGE